MITLVDARSCWIADARIALAAKLTSAEIIKTLGVLYDAAHAEGAVAGIKSIASAAKAEPA